MTTPHRCCVPLPSSESGETFADFINGKLGDNLNVTTLVMGSLLAVGSA